MNETTALTAGPARALIPAVGEWATIMQLAGVLVKSGFLPTTIKTAEAATAIIMKGRELGIPPMQAFSHIAVIQGKPACSSELQLALLARGGVTWEWGMDGSDGTAKIIFHRAGYADVVGQFSLDDAKRAELMGKTSWKGYPANMLRARAISNGARMIGPDLLMGMSYTYEELGAEVNEDETPITQVEVVAPPESAQATPSDVEAKLKAWCSGHGIAWPMFVNSMKKNIGKAPANLTEAEARAFCIAFKERHPEYWVKAPETTTAPEEADARGITPSMVLEFTELVDRALKADMLDEEKRDELIDWLDTECTKEELENRIANYTALFE